MNDSRPFDDAEDQTAKRAANEEGTPLPHDLSAMDLDLGEIEDILVLPPELVDENSLAQLGSKQTPQREHVNDELNVDAPVEHGFAEHDFKHALHTRQFQRAAQHLDDISQPERLALMRHRLRTAVVNELSELARQISLYLLNGNVHSARKVWHNLDDIAVAFGAVMVDASPALNEMAESVIALANRGVRLADTRDLVDKSIALNGVSGELRQRLPRIKKSLDTICDKFDALNQYASSEVSAAPPEKQTLQDEVKSLAERFNVTPEWCEYSLLSQIDRWPNVLRAVSPKKFNDNEALYFNYVGLRLLSEGKLSEAARHFKSAISLKPDLAAAHNNYAYLFVLSKDVQFANLEEGITHAQRAVELRPVPAFLDTLADLLRMSGNLDAAIATMMRAMDEDSVEPNRRALKLERFLKEKQEHIEPGAVL